MRELSGRTAVITGGASGIGLATARRLGREGMNIVIGDIEEPVLEQVVAEFDADGVPVMGVPTDVADYDKVRSLASAATERFGDVHVLFNNAGVGGGGALLEPDDLDVWDWTIGVNLMGVIHGIKAFGGAMVAHGDPCHIVNTASIAGLLPTPALGVYTATKYAVVAMSETLALETQDTRMGVSVLCPGFVATNIADSDRNLPEHMVSMDEPSPENDLMRAAMRDLIGGGMAPAAVGDLVRDAIVNGRFLVLTQPEFGSQITARAERLLAGSQPTTWEF